MYDDIFDEFVYIKTCISVFIYIYNFTEVPIVGLDTTFTDKNVFIRGRGIHELKTHDLYDHLFYWYI
jgi:hypothetical protein